MQLVPIPRSASSSSGAAWRQLEEEVSYFNPVSILVILIVRLGPVITGVGHSIY